MTIDKERRKKKVLEAIVKAHVESAFPIGSSNIAEMLGLSSATIRNVMLDLEREGYVTQPHTSAGRIPTDRGYRKYVDNLAHMKKASDDEIYMRVKRYLTQKKFYEEIIEEISHAISEITNYTGIALSPDNKFYFDGIYHMLEQPEFRELSTARDFLRIIEEKDDILSMLNDDLIGEGTRIRIGRENGFEELYSCAIITSVYKIKNRPSGNIGVIGPMRMKYEKIVPAIECIAQMTTDALEEIAG